MKKFPIGNDVPAFPAVIEPILSVVKPIETTENKGTPTSSAPKNVAYLIHMGKAAKKVFVK